MNVNTVKKYHILFVILILFGKTFAQDKALVNTARSPFAVLQSVDMHDVTWTSGFWSKRFEISRSSMLAHMWKVYTDPAISHAFANFRIAAGLDTGRHTGPPFHDGDFYKVLEGIASLYATTGDENLNRLMDEVIPVIGAAQRSDGYIHTPVIIKQRKENNSAVKEFESSLNFETYNIGHLMTAACVHYRATGKRSLLDIAIKATDFLNNYYNKSAGKLSRNTICPSHYMGIIEMYRTTGNKQYLALVRNLIDIRGDTGDGTDDNQDRIPFRKQTEATGHAVRANYLYAGIADVYAETGEDSLLQTLDLVWEDVVNKKMYITGGCGALYDGVSPYGTSYRPPEIQKTHQAYGRAYQLPNMTAHNETCANIGNMLWNWRMFQITGKAKYVDVLELALYNSVLSGVDLDGDQFFYTNPLSASETFPITLRWSGERQGYISLSNCCPPNAFRTLAQINHYAYSVSGKGVWINLYGSNRLSTTLANGSSIKLTQESNYPWKGTIKIRVDEAPEEKFSLFFRVPGWVKNARFSLNAKRYENNPIAGEYTEINRKWMPGDIVELELPMPAILMEANPLVEEVRNQVAVKRGPIVYCLESTDLSSGKNIFDVIIPANVKFEPKPIKINNAEMVCLKGDVKIDNKTFSKAQLYREVTASSPETFSITLIPYFAWANRGKSEMTVWLPLSK